MKNDAKKIFKAAINEALTGEQFSHKGQSWFLHGADVTIVLNLQKSDHKELFYVNLGIWFNHFNEKKYPEYNECQIYFRLENIFESATELISEACQIDGGGNKISEFSEFLKNEFSPYAREMLNIKYVAQQLAEGKFKNSMVLKTARDFLSARVD